MEWSVLFMGPVGSGKTTAIRSISDIEVAGTDELATDHVANIKSHTTVSMDVGTLKLGEKDKLRLIGSPGQDRFDFMWDILLDQAKGVVVVIQHSAPNPLADLDHYLKALDARSQARELPLVVAISHIDQAPQRPLSMYQTHFRETLRRTPEATPPVLAMDARNPRQVRAVLVAMTALLEMLERFPRLAARA